MAKITIICGMLLALLGVVCYAFWHQFGADHASPTALIPAGFGAILILLGLFTLTKPALRMHLMHASVTLALIGFLASLPMGVHGLIKKGFVVAPIAQLIMAIICGVYVVLCVNSFIAARKARKAAQV